jgi:hypothetical protein
MRALSRALRYAADGLLIFSAAPAAIASSVFLGHSSSKGPQQPWTCNQVVLLLQQQRLQHTSPQPHKPIDQQLAEQLLSAVGGKGSLSASVLQQHGVDEGYAPPMPPDIVVYPQNTQQVRKDTSHAYFIAAWVSLTCLYMTVHAGKLGAVVARHAAPTLLWYTPVCKCS